MHEDIFNMEKVMEHYEVYRNGKFFCSADTPVEAAIEIDKEKEKHIEGNGMCYIPKPFTYER